MLLLVVLVFFVAAVRVVLVFAGRTTVQDGFYLQNAFLLGRGFTPYEDFVHVAFPFVEALYAPLLAIAPDRLAAASLLTGAAVLATALCLFAWVKDAAGARAGFAAGALYATAAPLVAWHAFQREAWSALFLAAAAWALCGGERGRAAPSHGDAAADRRALLGGVLLAAALCCKLTAVVGAASLLLEPLLRRRARDAAIASLFLAATLGTATLLLAARHGSEFLTQVFLFFFFKGEAGDVASRGTALLAHVDPAFALGVLGLGIVLAKRVAPLRAAALLFGAWLLFHLFVSPSFWDHNAIDLALPAAALGGFAVDRVLARPRPLAVAALAVCIAAGARGLAPQRPLWFPHGLGGGQGEAALQREADALARRSSPDEPVQAPTPLVSLLAGRRSFVGDFELEPVARGLLAEVRLRGLAAAWARRNDGALLGADPAADDVVLHGTLFERRVARNVLAHLLPRLRDALRHREIAALVESPVTKRVEPVLRASGYVRVPESGVALFVRE